MRKNLVIIVLFFLVISLFMFSLVPKKDVEALNSKITGISNWPMFRRDIFHTAFSPETISPPLVKKFEVGLPASTDSSPAIVSGSLYIGAEDSHLYCLNSQSGEVNWKFKTNGAVKSSPAVVDGIVYFGSDDGYIYALREDGRKIWQFKTGGKVSGSPTVYDGIVYIGSFDSSMYAISAEAGTLIWEYKTNGMIFSSPAIYGNYLFFGSDDSNLYAVDRLTGKLYWKKEYKNTRIGVSHAIFSSPTVNSKDGTVYFGSYNNYFYAVNYENGVIKWFVDTGQVVFSSPALSSNNVLGVSEGGIFCIDSQTGKIKWNYPVSSIFRGSPVIAYGYAYVTETNGQLSCINMNNGEIEWYYNAPEGGGRPSPVIAEGNLYFTTGKGKIYAFTTKEALATPILKYSPQELDFGTVARGVRSTDYIYIMNNNRDLMTGAVIGTLKGNLTSDADWLFVSPKTFEDNKITAEVSIKTDSLESGKSYMGTISIFTNGGDGKVKVYVAITPEKKVTIKLYIGKDTAYINNEPKKLDAAPFIDAGSGRTLVPLRFIAEAFGANVSWEGSTQTITITLKSTKIILQIGKKTATVNDKTITIDQAPIIVKSRTFVPVRFIAEAFGAEVLWNGALQEVTINYTP